jgi:hypothetical protein
MAAVPIAAFIAGAPVAVTIIDAPVITDVSAPISGVTDVPPREEAPETGRPESAGIGSAGPYTRHPVIVGVCVIPVAGCPDVAITGTGRLVIVRKRRGRFWSTSYRRLGIVAFFRGISAIIG